jgi:hypothetical protein
VEVGRVTARQRVLPLDHLEQRLLLTEEVGVGAEDQADGDVAGQAGGRHLGERRPHGVDLDGERGLEGQVRVRGAHHERGDGQPLDQLVGVVTQDRPVLERARLAFGAVGHDEPGLVAAAALERREPLAARPEPASAAASQARQAELLGGHPGAEGPGGAQAFAASPGPIVGERSHRLAVQHDMGARRQGARGHGGVEHGFSQGPVPRPSGQVTLLLVRSRAGGGGRQHRFT